MTVEWGEIDSAKSAIADDDDELMRAITEHDERFHTMIAKIAGNSTVESAFAKTHCHLHLFRLYVATQKHLVDTDDRNIFVQDLFARYYQSDKGQLAVKQHSAIAKAIIAHNGPKARVEMHTHIESSLKRFTSYLHLAHTGTEK